MLRQKIQRFEIHRGFRQPHAFRFAAETEAKVLQPPIDLGSLIARVGQRHDHMAVALRHGRSVPGEPLCADLIGGQDVAIRVRYFFGQPRKQRGAEIEIHASVVIDDLDNPILRIQNARSTVRRIAFGRDPFVPIVVGVSRILLFYRFEPGVLAWGLVKMAVDTKVTHKNGSSVDRFFGSSVPKQVVRTVNRTDERTN